MPEYIVNLWLDGYDTEEQMEKACDEFIYDQLNFTASSVRLKRSDYASLLARHNALVDAVAWERECWDVEMLTQHKLNSSRQSTIDSYFESDSTYKAARAEVDRLIANETAADCKEDG